ncbi:hypothetical protein [Vibrio methylphosphonaticus]|uniref:hypothetical protein n=1 Tax=Vibrio methylphosphonaticus TaxID=2946866 RepID=UPI00202A7CED|nr:hypothetical protein [Vibrio methylphosphonaticus]MCL9775736.1 hypothetical protein [Vibrio methylphosphonaticus]
MNPVLDKVTDPTFTNSAKGLMTLFCIGLAHMVLGVGLEDVKIAIPWFPTINFESPQNLIYLYWGLVWYAMYRYVLEHATVFRKHWFNALASSLEIGKIGESFVRQSIFISKDHYYVNIRTIEDLAVHTIDINTYQYDETEYSSELVYSFSFRFNGSYQFESIKSSEDLIHRIPEAVSRKRALAKKWGLKPDSDEHHVTYRSYKITSVRYRMRLLWLKSSHYLKEFLRNGEVFDLSLPLIFNMALFSVWVINELHILK